MTALDVRRHNRAQDIIESLMVAANTSMAELLEANGVASLRRVVRAPEQWPRIVETAESFGERLPDEPDPRALSDFMSRRRAADPGAYPELSLAILKMLGPGDYMVEAPGLEQEGHFGLAVHDYTHSTAPNRRFPDLVSFVAQAGGIDRPEIRLVVGKDDDRSHARGPSSEARPLSAWKSSPRSRWKEISAYPERG